MIANIDRLKKSLELNNRITHRDEKGFFRLDYDKQAIKEFEAYVNENLGINLKGLERIKWLIDNNFYVSEIIENYTPEQITKIIDDVYAHNFQFASYMSIKKFYDAYALRTDDKQRFLETYEDRVVACALFLAKGDFLFAQDLAKLMIEQKYQPSTPTFSNSGKKRAGELVSCFLLDMDDSINSISYIISNAMQLSKIGGGVAINLTRLRARGAKIKDIASIASGVIPVLKILEDVFDYADQLGQRRGAGAAFLNIFHLDVIDFLDSKKINADEKSRIQTLSIGLIVPDKFFELCSKGADYFLFEPHTIYKKYGIQMADMDMNEWYDKLASDPDIQKKSVSARGMLNMIARTQFESGYPYIAYIDSANRNNPLKKIGKIQMTNLCTEIFQIQEPSFIADYGSPNDIRRDVSCNLGSLNINSLFEGDKDLEKIVEISMRALTAVSDRSNIVNAPGVKKANSELHSVGLGAMNLNGFLVKHQISYDDPLALEFVDVLFAAINYYSITASAKIAKEKQQKFQDFDKSDYATGEYFDKYLENEYLPKSPKIKSIFAGMKLPKKEDWANLKTFVQKHGLYNAYRLAIAPTQTISYVQNATSSVGPIVSLIETRLFGDSLTYYPMPFLNKENQFYYKSAYQLDQTKIIDLVSVIQNHIDQGISTVLFVTNQTSTRDLAKLYFYAWKKGLKSLYYTRTKNLAIDECLACSV